ncbi:MAG: Dabb family protein [Candidatus Hydrogenedentes bacterium]|nr:Dabb family protein [Candidatus Hydrogenedentota bacterium]
MRFKYAAVFVSVFALLFCLFPGTAGRDVFAGDTSIRLLRHVVLFQFKEGTTPAQVREVEAAFCRLPDAIDAIHELEWGTNVSPENLDQGFTHCFFLTFKSEEDRDAYLPHPAHKEFGKVLRPYLEKVTVIDYWTKP